MWRRPRLVTADTRRPGPRPGRSARLRGAFAPGAGRQCRRRKRTLGRQRHGGAPRGGLPVAREGPRLASVASRLTSATYSRLAPVGAPPSPRGGGSKMKDRSPGRCKRRGSDESCGSTRIAARKNERVVAGTSGTGLFDIVNRGSAASCRLRSVSRGDAPSCVVVSAHTRCRPRAGGDPVFHRPACMARWVPNACRL